MEVYQQNMARVISELRSSLAWADLVLANLHEAVVVVDQTMKILFANDAFVEMIDGQRIFILGENLWDVFPIIQQKKNISLKNKQKAISEENIKEFNGTYKIQLGEKFFVIDVTAGYIPRLQQNVFVFHDITKRTLAEEKLKAAKVDLEEAKAKDEATLASIGEGLIAVDQEEKIVLMNKVAEEMLGCKIADVIGKSIFETFELKNKDKLLPVYERPLSLALASGKKIVINASDQYELVTTQKSFPVVITVTPIILNGHTIGAVQIFRDATEDRQIDKAKSEFVSLAPHQLRTPLTAIKWYTEMLLEGDAGAINAEQKDYLEKVDLSIKRMVELVNSLLNVSRIDLGTLSSDVQPTNLVETAESVFLELQSQIEIKKLNIEKEYNKNLPLLIADPKLIRIIFQNLLSNAVKYTPAGGRISLFLQQDGENILMKFADNGYGIPKSQQSKIFTKLFRADNILARETEGTGLGLYIVKAIVEQAGGNINFQSEENKGTTFDIVMPIMKKSEIQKPKDNLTTKPKSSILG